MNGQIRFAKEAVRKLRNAAAHSNSVYLYGATGYGKTSILFLTLPVRSGLTATTGRTTSRSSCRDAARPGIPFLITCIGWRMRRSKRKSSNWPEKTVAPWC